MFRQIERKVTINAPISTVWGILTNPHIMQQWAGDADMRIEILTNWVIGQPILIKGFHHVFFENKGKILQFDPPFTLSYSHLSSISNLLDIPENYTIITFQLKPSDKETLLLLVISNFPSESILKHLDFYWKTTLAIIKNIAGK